MKLMEYEGKALFKEAGIPVPGGIVVEDAEDTGESVAEILYPAVVKAQVLSGSRGKRGGIKFVDSEKDAGEVVASLLTGGFAGEKVGKVLIEEKVNLAREFYISITVDGKKGAPVLMASAEGGVDIESVPQEKISIIPVEVLLGLRGFQVRDAVKNWGLKEDEIKQIVSIGLKLYQIFRQYDAELVEINPLGLTSEGKILALDAKVIVNDNAVYRQQRFPKSRERYDNDLEYRASQYNLNYVKLDGNIGLLCTGAGLTLATLDLISDYGGKAANFLESGGANYANSYHGLELVLSDPDVKVLLINTFGLVSRSDVICRGLADSLKKLKPKVPIVASIRGTGEEEAQRIFKEELGINPFSDTEEAVKEAVKLAR